MGLTDFVPAEYKFAAQCALVIGLVIAVTSVAGYAVYIYKDRQNLQAENKRLVNDIQRNKDRAAEIFAAKVAENAQLKDKYDAEAKQKDADFAKTIARFNARDPVGMRDLPAGCGSGSGSAGQAQADSAGTPEKAAAERGTGDAVRELAITEGAVAQILGWYAYGMSCHAEVNSK